MSPYYPIPPPPRPLPYSGISCILIGHLLGSTLAAIILFYCLLLLFYCLFIFFCWLWGYTENNFKWNNKDTLLANFRQRSLYVSIESHFVGVHGPYELHLKEEQIKCTALAVHENLLFFPMQFIWPVNTDKMRFNTYIYIFLQQSLSRYCLL